MRRKDGKSRWLSFEQAKAWAQQQNFNSVCDWHSRIRGIRTANIPISPDQVYASEWISWPDFLGYAPPRWTFDQASEWAKQQNIQTSTEWNALAAAGLPSGISAHPERQFSAEWQGWGLFLGTGNISNIAKSKRFGSFDDAREWARQHGIASFREWRARAAKGLPSTIPANPQQVYKDNWRGWGDFLGSGRVSTQKQVFLSYQQVKDWAGIAGIKSQREWKRRSRAGLPPGVPTNPNRSYPEFEGWPQFLGTAELRGRRKLRWAPMADAQKWARVHGIDSQQKWRAATKAGMLPPDIPSAPDRCYTEWESWDQFFDNGNSKNREWWPIDQATAWLRKHGIASREMWDHARAADLVPKLIPSSPTLAYGADFRGWSSFFGREIRGGSSFIEHVLRVELSHFLVIEPAISRILTVRGRTIRVDIVSSACRLVVEYDGWYWHHGTEEKDVQVSMELEASGWRVLRVREAPLQPIRSNDIIVSRKATLFDKSVALLRHLAALGMVDCDALRRYESKRELYAAKYSNLMPMRWRQFDLAVAWSRSLALKTQSDWKAYKRTYSLPADIPANPDHVYQPAWRGWRHWLSSGA